MDETREARLLRAPGRECPSRGETALPLPRSVTALNCRTAGCTQPRPEPGAAMPAEHLSLASSLLDWPHQLLPAAAHHLQPPLRLIAATLRAHQQPSLTPGRSAP